MIRALHILAICCHGLIGIPFFAFMFAYTGSYFFVLMCGWEVFFGAWSVSKLRAMRKASVVA